MKFNKTAAIVIGAVLAVIIMVMLGVNAIHANAIKYEENVTEAQSAIKVEEKKRADLYPNLVDCVKAYDKHEAETLLNVVNARKAQGGEFTDADVNEINRIINIVLEQYPALSSQKNYETLMNDISLTENEIANTRRAYNKTVSRYNEYTRPPLTKFFLSITGYERIEFQKLDYEVSEDAPMNLFD